MTKYRKKPVVIEAVQWDGTLQSFCDFPEQFTSDAVTYYGPFEYPRDGLMAYEPTCLLIETLEGIVRASVGDYIIKGVQGEVYPCKPAIFEKTYEEVK